MPNLFFPKKIETPENGILYDIDDIRKFMRKWGQLKIMRWDTWFNGQTGMIFEGKYCVYESDFRRFCEQQGLMWLEK